MPASPTIEMIGAQDNADALLARLAEFDGGIAAPDLLAESPVTTGDFSLPLDTFLGLELADTAHPPTESPALTVINDYLPSIESQAELLGNLQESELLGELMREARLSKLTGCFMRPEAYRNHNGYSRVKSKAAKEIGVGSYRDAHRVAHFLYKTATTGLPPTSQELNRKMTVDHICRNPSCCNPEHTRLLTNKANNILKDRAKKIEPKIIEGQGLYVADLYEKLSWLEHTIIFGEAEIPERVISTRLGPFALRAASADGAWVYGHKLFCDVYESLRELGENKYFAPSRAKPFTPVKNNKDLFHKNKFKKKNIPTQKELYDQAMGLY